MATQPRVFLTPERYLEIERAAETKSEYLNGEMFAMAGAGESHNLIVMNIGSELRNQFRKRACRVYSNDMRVRVKPDGLYTYPDVVAVCGKPVFPDGHTDTLLNPTLLVEVLSRSMELWDRGRKFEYYQALASLSEFLLIASDRIRADLYTRQPDGRWLLSTSDKAEDTVTLESVGATLTLSDVYEKVDFTG